MMHAHYIHACPHLLLCGPLPNRPGLVLVHSSEVGDPCFNRISLSSFGKEIEARWPVRCVRHSRLWSASEVQTVCVCLGSRGVSTTALSVHSASMFLCLGGHKRKCLGRWNWAGTEVAYSKPAGLLACQLITCLLQSEQIRKTNYPKAQGSLGKIRGFFLPLSKSIPQTGPGES